MAKPLAVKHLRLGEVNKAILERPNTKHQGEERCRTKPTANRSHVPCTQTFFACRDVFVRLMIFS